MIALLLAACATAPDGEVLVFVGDVALGRGVAEALERGGDPWADWPDEAMVGNLEGSVAVDACRQDDPALCLGFAEHHLDRLAGRFLALGMENNHVADHGEAGRTATHDGLAARGIAALDLEGAPHFVEVGATMWGLVPLDLSRGDLDPTVLERALLAVATARARTPWVAVLPHWGDELEPRPRPGQQAIAATFHAWGAALVVGGGAHVVQPASCSEAGGTWLGLGNHLFDQAPEQTWRGAAVRCETAAGATTCTTVPTARSARSLFPVPGAAPAEPRCTLRGALPDLVWTTHPSADELLGAQPLPAAGENAWFALWSRYSTFDDVVALRPRVFAIADGEVQDLWRGTALPRPLAAARLVDGGRALCALLRGDSFLDLEPADRSRSWMALSWNGFGFDPLEDASACAVLDPDGVLTR